MIELVEIITNNPMVLENCKHRYDVEYIDGTMLDVFKKVRDLVHLNHKLLTHPLISSIKPNEVPYRTVVLSKNICSNIDFQSLEIIENSIITTEKFLRDFKVPKWSHKILKDFQFIDFDMISTVLK